MFEENVINFILVSIFCAISLSYIFDINFISSLIITSSVFFISFMITFFLAEKRYIKPIFKLYIPGMIISAFFTIFKIPFYPLIYLEIYYYQKVRKIYAKKIIAGQHTNTYFGPEIAYIKYVTGKLPALRGFDLLSYSSCILTEDMQPETIIEIEGNKNA